VSASPAGIPKGKEPLGKRDAHPSPRFPALIDFLSLSRFVNSLKFRGPIHFKIKKEFAFRENIKISTRCWV
jgi:hypothetical protein